MPQHPDVLIIGGGVIGLTAAYFLGRDGTHVEVVDQGDFGQEASWAGAGILPPGNPQRAQTPLAQLRAHSAVLFPALSAELQELTGIDNGYIRSGGLDFLLEEHQATLEEWRREGIRFEVVAGKELRRVEPALADDPGHACFFPDMAQVRNPRHVRALLAAGRRHGAELRSGCPVLGLEREGERITAAKTAAGRMRANRFIVAAGAWSDALLESIGWRPGIHPVRGQIALVNTGVPMLRRILLQDKRYLVPRSDGRVLIGSTEEDAGFDKGTTASAVRDLLAFAIALVPGLGDAPLERAWAGLRPGSPDHLPFIGPVPRFANLFVAAGHFRAGIQLSPATGLMLKELLLGQELTIPAEPFRLDRPPATPRQTAFRS
jgi:glycine oxidase